MRCPWSKSSGGRCIGVRVTTSLTEKSHGNRWLSLDRDGGSCRWGWPSQSNAPVSNDYNNELKIQKIDVERFLPNYHVEKLRYVILQDLFRVNSKYKGRGGYSTPWNVETGVPRFVPAALMIDYRLCVLFV